MEDISIGSIFRKTFMFVIIKAFVILLTIGGTVALVLYFEKLFFELVNLNVSGIFYIVFSLNFKIVGFYVAYIFFHYVRKTLLFYIKSAHVIAITKILTDDDCSDLFFDSFNEIRKRFISMNVFLLSDSIAFKSIHEIGHILIDQNITNSLQLGEDENKWFLGIKKFGLKMLKSTVSHTLNYCDEIVLSYAYVQCRVRELYPEDFESTESGTRKKKEKVIFQYIIDGICFYVHSCVSLLKKSFVTILAVDFFCIFLTILLCLVKWWLYPSSIDQMFLYFIYFKILFEILKYLLVEPYETIVMLHTFYDALYDEADPLDVEAMKQTLVASSASFASLVATTLGTAAVLNVARNTGAGTGTQAALGLNITSALRNSLESLLGVNFPGRSQQVDADSSNTTASTTEDNYIDGELASGTTPISEPISNATQDSNNSAQPAPTAGNNPTSNNRTVEEAVSAIRPLNVPTLDD